MKVYLGTDSAQSVPEEGEVGGVEDVLAVIDGISQDWRSEPQISGRRFAVRDREVAVNIASGVRRVLKKTQKHKYFLNMMQKYFLLFQ